MIDFELEVTVIILADADLKHFINDRQYVIQRAHGLERRGIQRTDDATRGSKDECIFDDDQRNAAIIKSCGEESIIAAEGAGGSGRMAIRIENVADVILLVGLFFHEGCLLSALGIA